jgi:predicted negative regulator of RcsB-dependent stress response
LPKHKIKAKELKHDPFQDWYMRQAEKVVEHRDPIVGTIKRIGLAILLIIVVTVGYNWWSARAERRLGEASDVFNAEVTATPPANAATRTFKTDEEKYRAAMEAYRRVSTSSLYSWTDYGDTAKYYEAVCQLHLNPTEGQSALENLAKDNSLTARLARVALAEHAIAKNDFGKAESLYKQLVDDPGPLPKPQLQLGLARTMELQGKKSEAVALYVQVAKDRLQEPEKAEAVARIAAIDPKALDQVPTPKPPEKPPSALDKYTKK